MYTYRGEKDMAYFRQTDSLDDLKQQYKRLLTKFDYKDPKNAKLLEAIDKEYKKCQMYAKMAPLRKAKDDISRKLDESERERVRQEQERAAYNAEIKRRTQMHYTKADCERYLNEACRALKNYAFLKVRDNTKTGHSSACRTDLYNFRMDGYRKTYINMRTLGRLGGENGEYSEIMRATDNVEIAFVALSDEKNKDQILRKLEEKLGMVYVNAYKEACEKYMDEVEYARTLASENKQDRADKRTKPFRNVFYAFTRVVASIVFGVLAFGIMFVIFIAFSDVANNRIIENTICIIGIFVGILAAILVIKLVNRLLDFDQHREVTDKKTAYSRVTEGEKFDEMQKFEQKTKSRTGVLRLILRLIGFRV